ncbi:MAG: cupin domain-containing protein [Candidatus Shapirobacteria bacterium]|jgi:quercetin dioxygenase-like cupin family protein
MTDPQNINHSVKIQPGSVVSREIINKSFGTVTVFAFDKNQGLSEHTAPFDALIIATEGACEIIVSGASHTVKAGEMFLLPANAPHSLKAIKAFKMILIMIKSV